MVRNPASGRVLARLGFHQEGLLRERLKKWGVYEDVVLMTLLSRQWAAFRARARPAPRRDHGEAPVAWRSIGRSP